MKALNISLILVSIFFYSCSNALDKVYTTESFENDKLEILSIIDSIEFENIEFELLYTDNKSQTYEQLLEAGKQRRVNMVVGLVSQLDSLKKNRALYNVIQPLFANLYQLDSTHSLINEYDTYLTNLKLSSFQGVILGDDESKIVGFEKTYEEGNTKRFQKEGVEVNGLVGDFRITVTDGKVTKLMFVTADMWLGSTRIANSVFQKIVKSQVAWVEKAMSYYGISSWEALSENEYRYSYNGVKHKYLIRAEQTLGITIGYTLFYTIADEKSEQKAKQEEQAKITF